MQVQDALSEFTSRGITWKKTKERNKAVLTAAFFVFMDKQRIWRAATLTGIPLAARKRFEKGTSGNCRMS